MVRMSSQHRTQTIQLKSIFVYPLIHISEGIIIYFTSEDLFINLKNSGRNSRDSFVLYGRWPRCPPLFRQPLTKGS